MFPLFNEQLNLFSKEQARSEVISGRYCLHYCLPSKEIADLVF